MVGVVWPVFELCDEQTDRQTTGQTFNPLRMRLGLIIIMCKVSGDGGGGFGSAVVLQSAEYKLF